MRVLIVGAGTGGLALAHLLKQSNIDVSVFERDLVPNADTGGYRVGISAAGSRAIKACVPSDTYDLFVATSARAPRYFNMFTEQFSEVLCLELSGEATDAMDGEKNVIRKTLRRILLSGLEDAVSFGKSLVSYTQNADGTVTAHFGDGSSATGEVLIGADGTGSAVRRQRLPDARLQDTGMVSLGGKLPMTTASKALLTDKMFYGMSMIMAPKGFGAIIHSLDFSPNRANAKIVARWPKFADALDDDSIGWGLWGARQHFPKNPATLGGEELLQLGAELTRDWHPHMQALIQMTEPAMAQHIEVRTSVPVLSWKSSNVTLLGDAIHTMTPGRGAGANTALRDAMLLGQSLIKAAEGSIPLIDAIHDYEVQMRRYSTVAVNASRKQFDADDLIHKPVIGRIQLALVRTVMRAIDASPTLRRRTLQSMMRVRGAD